MGVIICHCETPLVFFGVEAISLHGMLPINVEETR